MIGLKEWSSVVDAIGRGEQTIIVRGYEPKVQRYFLYPTYSFYVTAEKNPELFEQQFQPKYIAEAKVSGAKTYERGRNQLWVDVDYFSEVQKTFWIQNEKAWKALEPFYIWNGKHVADYAKKTKRGEACLWLTKTYKLATTKVLGRTNMGGPPSYHQHLEEIESNSAAPVLNDDQFAITKESIEKILKTL